MKPKIAIFGGSFNPPGLHHRAIAEMLSEHFDRVIIFPCGPRPDKVTTNDVAPLHRAVMTDVAFAGIPRVEVDLSDLELDTFTRTHALDERFSREGEVWHVVGTDLLYGGATNSFVVKSWAHGRELWQKANFAVLTREGFTIKTDDLPPHHKLFLSRQRGASSEIRERIFRHQSISDLVTPEVAIYIDRYNLYSGRPTAIVSSVKVDLPRLLLVFDHENENAKRLAEALRPLEDKNHPNLIVALGGDGTMLRAIREHWRRRLPFVGLNLGHRGFLLNKVSEGFDARFFSQEFKTYLCPLFYVELEDDYGETVSGLAFNDVWLERSGGQSAWIEACINDEVYLPRIVGDGVLVSTAAGSTAYARAMGAVSVPLGTNVMLLVGSNIVEPAGWKPTVYLPTETKIELITLDQGHPRKRPLRAFVDGVIHEDVCSLKVRVSRIAAAELAFMPNEDMAAKLARLQFPG